MIEKDQDGAQKGGGDDSGAEDNEDDQIEAIKQVLQMSQMEKEAHRLLFPSRNTFNFKDGLQVTSDFDSGNITKCVLTNNPDPNAKECLYSFEFSISSDSHPYMPNVSAGRAGFFFAVKGIADGRVVYDQ